MTPEDPSLQELESALQKLEPNAPSEELTARIFSAFDTPTDAAPAEVESVTPIESSSSWFQPFAAAAAVALIAGVVAIIGLNRPSGTEDSPTYLPAHAQNTYEGSEVDGIVFNKGSHPMQKVRHQFTDTYTWENPDDGSRVEIRVPVERVRYVPVPTD